MRDMITVVITSLLLGFAAGPAAATTYYIEAGGGGDYPTIQDAINVAIADDTILLEAATFTGAGNVNIDYQGKAIVITGESAAENTIIDCNQATRGFNFVSGEPSQAVLENLTIIRGNANAFTPAVGGAIYVSNNSSPTIRNVKIDNCRAINGGGIAVDDLGSGNPSSPEISDCEITNCVAEGLDLNEGGGGIYVNQASPTIIACDIGNNQSNSKGGGILLDGTIGESVGGSYSGNWIHHNQASYFGGGICIVDGAATLAVFDNVIHSNSADRGGGMSIEDFEPGGIIETNTITENSATDRAAGLYMEQVAANEPVVRRSIIAFNTGASEAVYCNGEGNVTCSVLWNPDISNESGCTTFEIVNEDPQFCGIPGSFFYELQSDSPATEANSPCGARIGAEDVGCQTSDTVKESLGTVRSLFR